MIFRILACSVDVMPCPPESQVWATLTDTVDFAALGVTPADVLYTFTWGAGAVLSLWALGYAVGSAIAAIRKA